LLVILDLGIKKENFLHYLNTEEACKTIAQKEGKSLIALTRLANRNKFLSMKTPFKGGLDAFL